MGHRNNHRNDNGVTSIVAGGNVGTSSIFVTQSFIPSRKSSTPAVVTVLSNGHAVEVDSDGGLFDTVSNVPVDRSQTNIDTIGI